MSKPFFSLVISTIGNYDISYVLDSFVNQEFKDFEVIVVDQSKSDYVFKKIESYKKSLDIKCIKTTERGASRGRNRGIREARGEYVTFPDDDCLFYTSTLLNVKFFLINKPSVDLLTVLVADEDSSGGIAKLDSSAGVIKKENVLIRSNENGIFVKRKMLDQVIFDPDMGVGSGTLWGSDEGPDFILRLIYEGADCYYTPEIKIFHPSPKKIIDESIIKRSASYSVGRGYFLRKHDFNSRILFREFIRPFGGAIIYLLRFKFNVSKYYWVAFVGKLKGYFH